MKDEAAASATDSEETTAELPTPLRLPPPLPPEYVTQFAPQRLEYSPPEPRSKGHWMEAAVAALMLLVGAVFFLTMLSMLFR